METRTGRTSSRVIDETSDTTQARRVIRLAQIEAFPFAIMTGFTDPFMVPYVLALGGSCLSSGGKAFSA